MADTDQKIPADIAKMSFEAALEELEAIVSRLEDGDIDLDKSIDAYERGAALKAHCDHKLAEAEARIDKIDPATGQVLASIPAPGNGNDSGLAWAEGSLWVGQYRDRRIHQIDPETGAVKRTIESNRFVTGVTWVEGELWHGTWEGDESELRRIHPESGAVLERLTLPEGVGVSGLESDGADLFWCGGGGSGKLRAVRRPRAATRAAA